MTAPPIILDSFKPRSQRLGPLSTIFSSGSRPSKLLSFVSSALKLVRCFLLPFLFFTGLCKSNPNMPSSRANLHPTSPQTLQATGATTTSLHFNEDQHVVTSTPCTPPTTPDRLPRKRALLIGICEIRDPESEQHHSTSPSSSRSPSQSQPIEAHSPQPQTKAEIKPSPRGPPRRKQTQLRRREMMIDDNPPPNSPELAAAFPVLDNQTRAAGGNVYGAARAGNSRKGTGESTKPKATYKKLAGPHEDVALMRKLLIEKYAYAEEDIVALMDDDVEGHDQPTKVNIVSIDELVKDVQAGDTTFFHYSGHGMQEPTDDPSEEDKKNKVMPTCDGQTILDDVLHARLVAPLPPGCKIFALLDELRSLKLEVKEMGIINGFGGSFHESTLQSFQYHAAVLAIHEECTLTAASVAMHTLTQPHTTWALARLSANSYPIGLASPYPQAKLSFTYPSGGSCATIYIVDSGINIHHVDFQGRAEWGATFGKFSDDVRFIDEIGHGTHIAGIAGSASFGVAKGVRLVGVKVVGASRHIEAGNVVQALDWVYHHSRRANRPAIVNLSMTSSTAYAPLDTAVSTLIKNNITVVVSAGNDNTIADNYSPVRIRSAITVGSVSINDHRSPTSNYGSAVDLFAPGLGILSTWIGSTTATHVSAGTSMAAPHIAGMGACLVCLFPHLQYPPYMEAFLIHHAQKNIIKDIRKSLNPIQFASTG
ncbi:hypothetical protein CVT24_001411 [Panaeolus cyanescens]|uniref:Uncharacterized protein n=1 Tax=Panaeolus cyanescens TaxID=181874 RepID=A0A409YZ12_9AGAR|nr:hypothetical protein CVT24_001411 [Panaeolus cyanescens]